MVLHGLSDKERRAVELVIEAKLSKQEIADELGWKDRRSVYYVLEKDEAQEYMRHIAEKSVNEAIGMLKGNANQSAKQLIKIASGNISKDDKQIVFASLQAINSILEKSGLSSKNITLSDNREDKNKVSDTDILSALELDTDKQDKEQDHQ